jgi:hypothetical protein
VMPPEQRLVAEPIESLGDILGIRKDIQWRWKIKDVLEDFVWEIVEGNQALTAQYRRFTRH